MLLASSLSPGQGSDPAPAGPHAAGEPTSVLGPSPIAVVSPKAQPSARMVVVGFGNQEAEEFHETMLWVGV